MPSSPIVEIDCRAVAFTFGFCVEGDAQTGEVEHRQVVRAVSHGHRLGDVDPLELAEQPQQLGLAASVHDLSGIAARQASVLDLQLVGIDVVEAVFLPQVVSEVGETTGEDSRLVSHALEDGHHAFETLGDGQRMGDLLHDRDLESLEQGHAFGEAFAEVDLSPHGAFGDGAHLGADAGPFGQFVDHLGLDERGVHVEADQAAAAAVDVVAGTRRRGRSPERFMKRSCMALRSASVSDPRTESSMHERAVRSSLCRGTRPVRRRMASMLRPCSATLFVTSAMCRAVTVRPSRVMM